MKHIYFFVRSLIVFVSVGFKIVYYLLVGCLVLALSYCMICILFQLVGVTYQFIKKSMCVGKTAVSFISQIGPAGRLLTTSLYYVPTKVS